MKGGLLDGMSIGYEILSGGASFKGDYRELSALKLFEVSIATWPMNTEARVDTVKSAMDCGDVRELEQLMRERLGFSTRRAKAAATRCWPLLSEREARDDDREDREAEAKVAQIIADLKSLNSLLTKGKR